MAGQAVKQWQALTALVGKLQGCDEAALSRNAPSVARDVMAVAARLGDQPTTQHALKKLVQQQVRERDLETQQLRHVGPQPQPVPEPHRWS
jgi:hypothetical protein